RPQKRYSVILAAREDSTAIEQSRHQLGFDSHPPLYAGATQNTATLSFVDMCPPSAVTIK
ncbi:MAG TPA: hypothetical protein VEL11_15935, partial [Candidatus Bathyarchaeia archaeon]|nr:hypothetical protein [Candidatus Bathyarchaeia archaeon]